jgi:hypothetical protein
VVVVPLGIYVLERLLPRLRFMDHLVADVAEAPQ